MEKYQVINSEQADKDLENIAEYIALDSPEKALAYVKAFQEAIENILSIFPEKHRRYKDCHVFPYDNYLILFDIQKEQKVVDVISIVNAAQYLRYKDLLF